MKIPNYIEKQGVRYFTTVADTVSYIVEQQMDPKEQYAYLVGAEKALAAYFLFDTQRHVDFKALMKKVEDLNADILQHEDVLHRIESGGKSVIGKEVDNDGLEAPLLQFENVNSSSSKTAKSEVDVRVVTPRFFVRDVRFDKDRAIAMQDLLVTKHLIAPPRQDGHRYPLAIALGIPGFAGNEVEPIVWIGKINQLHYFVEQLVLRNIVGCYDNNHWMVAAAVFRPARYGRTYTNKKIGDARAIKKVDSDAVDACLPLFSLTA